MLYNHVLCVITVLYWLGNFTFYGPGPGGKGQVFAHSTPIVKHYKAHDMHRAIVPDLAALVWSACQVRDDVACYIRVFLCCNSVVVTQQHQHAR
jgi:hypothetical protein